jgi:hypothetical protein
VRTPIEFPSLRGAFNGIHLDFLSLEPPPLAERSLLGPNYPNAMAYLRILVDTVEPSQNVPRGYMMAILDGILSTMTDILSGTADTGRAEWQSGPWCLDLRGVLHENRLYLTLHRSHRFFAMEEVVVPFLLFAHEAIGLAHKWDRHLRKTYPDEIQRPGWDRDYLLFRSYLHDAEGAFKSYKKSA